MDAPTDAGALPAELDQLASYALTALIDPAAVPEPFASAIERAERRAVDPDDSPRAAFVVGCLDAICNTLQPPDLTRGSASHALTVLGGHLNALHEDITAHAESSGYESDRYAYQEAAQALGSALDSLDVAISLLDADGADDTDD